MAKESTLQRGLKESSLQCVLRKDILTLSNKTKRLLLLICEGNEMSLIAAKTKVF